MSRSPEALAPRPEGVPETARLVDASNETPAHWRDGVVEVGSAQLLGVHRWWSLGGDLLHVSRYDDRGRLLLSRSALHPDRVQTALEELLRSPERFTFHDLVSCFDDELYRRFRDALRDASTLHVLRFAEALRYLDVRLGRTGTRTTPRWDLIRELLAEWSARPSRADDADARALVALAEEASAAYRNVANAPGLHEVLGAEERGTALLLDLHDRAFWQEDGSCEPAPLEVDRWGPSYGRYLVDHRRPDERIVFWSEAGTWWMAQRYGLDLLLFGAGYSTATFRAEPTLDVYVRCPDEAWARRVMELFVAARPAESHACDAFEVPDHLLVREYRTHVEAPPRGPRLFLAVRGRELVGATPLGKRERSWSEPERPEPPPALEVEESFEGEVGSTTRFDERETTLFHEGYFLSYIHAVPITSP